MLAALLLVSAAPGGTVPSVSATEIYKAAQYCCAGCSYVGPLSLLRAIR